MGHGAAPVSGRIPSAGQIIRRHLLVLAAVTAGVVAALVTFEWRLASVEADRVTRETAVRVAEQVSGTLAETDFGRGSPDPTLLDARLDGFFAAGVVNRVKVWRVDGDVVRIVYSDERRLIGEERPYSPDLAARLDAEPVVVHDVPADVEHRFESAVPLDLREAFIAFRDAAGTPLRLEVYVPVRGGEWVASALGIYVPVMLTGLLALAAFVAPLSVRLARRLSEADRERRAAIDHALRAKERERLRLARRLHDDVLQDLSGAALALQALAGTEGDAGQLHRISQMLADDVRTLRRMLDEDVADPHSSLAEALDAAVEGIRTTGLGVDVEVTTTREPDAATRRLVADATRELVRNAREHADATHVMVSARSHTAGVELAVRDDGHGFTAGRTPESGHGLRLLRRAVAEVGGSVVVHSAASGTTVTVVVPTSPSVDADAPLAACAGAGAGSGAG